MIQLILKTLHTLMICFPQVRCGTEVTCNGLVRAQMVVRQVLSRRIKATVEGAEDGDLITILLQVGEKLF